ncbi:MAG: hypothetical protein EBZ51_09995, partial [Synechococcaceae bacterium WB9_2_112]|nr:hypothetical protein [Synechococcaceae bacterium WB9_2_112]
MARRRRGRTHLAALTLASLVLGTPNLAPPAEAAPDLLRGWRRFSSYPHLARGYTALRQGKTAEAEREARHILNNLDRDSREARMLLAEALQAQGRYGEALDALAPLPPSPLQRQIQLSWLNQRQPVPSNRVERWLQQSRGSQEQGQLAMAHAEQLRRQLGPVVAWRWLQSRGGPIAYRSGLAELARQSLAGPTPPKPAQPGAATAVAARQPAPAAAPLSPAAALD